MIFFISTVLLPAIIFFGSFIFGQSDTYHRTLCTENISNAKSFTPKFTATFHQNFINHLLLIFSGKIIIGQSAGVSQSIERFYGFAQLTFTRQGFGSYQIHFGRTHDDNIARLVGTDAELAVSQITFTHPLEQFQTDITFGKGVLEMRIGHKTIV